MSSLYEAIDKANDKLEHGFVSLPRPIKILADQATVQRRTKEENRFGSVEPNEFICGDLGRYGTCVL